MYYIIFSSNLNTRMIIVRWQWQHENNEKSCMLLRSVNRNSSHGVVLLFPIFFFLNKMSHFNQYFDINPLLCCSKYSTFMSVCQRFRFLLRFLDSFINLSRSFFKMLSLFWHSLSLFFTIGLIKRSREINKIV